jgi:adenosylcobinamide-GDP ribazoletransferase
MLERMLKGAKGLVKSFLGAVTFYSTIPLPAHWNLPFEQIARWGPLVGLLLGGLLAIVDWALQHLGFPLLTRTVLIVALWVILTGGLHLDGVMDAADGLAVTERQRRLEVMKDSSTGAFGVMAATLLLLLKTAALNDLKGNRWLGLMAAAGWGRWGQVMAIALYPYLKATGKGAFHKQGICLPQDILVGLGFLLALSGVQFWLQPHRGWLALEIVLAGSTIALGVGFWFYRQLGGHTGDTYGAVVEWSEALILCLCTLIFNRA